MAEEQKWQEQGSHTLCANNCGFFGSPTTLNLCSKCYKDRSLKEQQMKDAQLAVEKTLTQAKSSAASSSSSSGIEFDNARIESKVVLVEEDAVARNDAAPIAVARNDAAPIAVVRNDAAPIAVAETVVQANRCATCRRRVGITSFKCRCGVTFCGTHRYPEEHGCTFDYKAMGREAIATANPIVKAEKLDKI